ncbi:restriction endonuclease subunit R [Methanoculleus sp. FWC-SCC1]|uniref:Restriction endonuclease subunit R n=1 Tax=Methanoculleus frigidifontis TaxID=2584085 RepID=A0ABT8M6M4_9EURY|nr:DEAD/DEAH box helicase family protein [Methanoculleus sp. FWC-SCC1]MDN7023589.1 restriction endonuclease subunit R [Methanoculleus sp. FWC-SCC1]
MALHEWLILNDYVLHQFGITSKEKYRDVRALLSSTEGKDSEEREAEQRQDGISSFCDALLKWLELERIGGEPGLLIDPDDLETYDLRISAHLAHINQRRETPVRLKYFQWLAALFTEYYLHRFFTDRVVLLNSLNDHVEVFVNQSVSGTARRERAYDRFDFSVDDLRKLAFWMATGSGKTFLMHLTYLQFLYHNRNAVPKYQLKIDNILLITPGEDLTNQHLHHLKESSIPCERFQAQNPGGLCAFESSDTIKVIEIQKIVEQKKGSGASVDIESFGKKNLIFVDEAHKGSGGNTWRANRNWLAEQGFAFEYSATLGQAVGSGNGRNGANDLLAEYGKSILFDYSYRHFYDDGYGKEYRLLNVRDDAYDEDVRDTLFLANLLSFYQQKAVHRDYPFMVRDYNLADPLWLFVGSQVNVSEEESDVFKIISFLNRVVTERGWVIETIQRFLDGNSGIKTKNDHDLFGPMFQERRFSYIRQQGKNAVDLYTDILKEVFHVREGGSIVLTPLKGAAGEISVSCGGNPFFALIYVGDRNKFLELVEEAETALQVGPAIDHPSLFASINSHASAVNILIGAKKFLEGWDCYRVSAMGLLDIGQSEGTQIIQLFGRGVRLKGKDGSLKRSTSSFGDHPTHLPILETLNLFGVKADYLKKFEDYLRQGGMNTDLRVPFEIPITIQHDTLERGLKVPSIERSGFKRQIQFVLDSAAVRTISADLSVKVDLKQSSYYENMSLEADQREEPVAIPAELLDLLDWNRIYFVLLDYRALNGWSNIVFDKKELKKIIEDGNYALTCPKHMVRPTKFADIEKVENIAITILKKTLKATYADRQSKWFHENARMGTLTEGHGNFAFEKYIVEVDESASDIIQQAKEIDSNIDLFIVSNGGRFIANAFYERHLFQPLLTKEAQESKFSITPQELNSGERIFVERLREYVESHEAELTDKTIYLLRNRPNDKGVGFYKTAWFYPDFILWVVDNQTNYQRIVFADPKGIIHLNGFEDEKVQLCNDIQEVERRIKSRTGIDDFSLDSFIISRTKRVDADKKFQNPGRNRYDELHILFLEDGMRFVEKMLGIEG